MFSFTSARKSVGPLPSCSKPGDVSALAGQPSCRWAEPGGRAGAACRRCRCCAPRSKTASSVDFHFKCLSHFADFHTNFTNFTSFHTNLHADFHTTSVCCTPQISTLKVSIALRRFSHFKRLLYSVDFLYTTRRGCWHASATFLTPANKRFLKPSGHFSSEIPSGLPLHLGIVGHSSAAVSSVDKRALGKPFSADYIAAN